MFNFWNFTIFSALRAQSGSIHPSKITKFSRACGAMLFSIPYFLKNRAPTARFYYKQNAQNTGGIWASVPGPWDPTKGLILFACGGLPDPGGRESQSRGASLTPCRRGDIILKIPKISQPSARFRYNLHQFLPKISVKVPKHSRRLRRATKYNPDTKWVGKYQNFRRLRRPTFLEIAFRA